MPELTTKDALLEKMVEQTSLLKENIKDVIGILTPVGCVEAFAGSTTPEGWLLCDGSAVSRTTYEALFAVIGTTYGSGDGSTTFNLPNLTDRFIQGNSTSGTVKSAGLPNITGKAGFREQAGSRTLILANEGVFGRGTDVAPSGAYSSVAQGTNTTDASFLNVDASRSSSIYGNSTTVQPPAVTMRYIIKY